MTDHLKHPDGRWDLQALAQHHIEQNGLRVDYPDEVIEQTAEIVAKIRPNPKSYVIPDSILAAAKDRTDIPFVSVDNGTLWTELGPEAFTENPEANVLSRDIDQLQSAVRIDPKRIRVSVAVSDLDAFVGKDSPIDRFMDVNTGSIYTPDKVFNLIPPELAEDIVSLNPGEVRPAIVAEFTVTSAGRTEDVEVYPALVQSRTKLDYASVGAWYAGVAGPSPAMLAQGPEILENLKAQRQASKWLELAQDHKGALEFDRTEQRIITEDGNAVGFRESQKNDATEAVENFMITFNSLMGRIQREAGMTTLQRVLEPPAQWDEIRNLAAERGYQLPLNPDSKALSQYLKKAIAENPEEADEISISVIKLIGRAEYRVITADEELPGHFPLSLENYTQSTASIRRGGDRVSARILKAAYASTPLPYKLAELRNFAENLNLVGQKIKKAERAATKAVTATMLEPLVGETFAAMVTGVKKNKAWCRISHPPVEGILSSHSEVRIGQKITVKLTRVEVIKGWIDFSEVPK